MFPYDRKQDRDRWRFTPRPLCSNLPKAIENRPNRSATKKKKGCHGSRMTALEPSLVVKVPPALRGRLGTGEPAARI
jgi:hypothetical protein